MAIWHLRSRRKPTGGLLKRNRKIKLSERGKEFTGTSIGDKKLKKRRTRGGKKKTSARSLGKINVVDKEKKEIKTAKILGVMKNPANPHFVRRNIITKGAVLETDIGVVKVTSRPGQDGVLNGN